MVSTLMVPLFFRACYSENYFQPPLAIQQSVRWQQRERCWNAEKNVKMNACMSGMHNA